MFAKTTETLKLDEVFPGRYEGQEIHVWFNFPLPVLETIWATRTIGDWYKLITESNLITGWTLKDEGGQPLPGPGPDIYPLIPFEIWHALSSFLTNTLIQKRKNVEARINQLTTPVEDEKG